MVSLLITYFNAFQLVLLRENGDDQPLVLRTKQILKETLMIGLSSIRYNSLAFLMQQRSLAFLGCGSVKILFSRAQLFEGLLALNPRLNLTRVSFSCV